MWRTGSLLAWTTSTLHVLPSSSWLKPAEGGWAHIKLADVDDLFSAQATILEQSPAGCWGMSHRKLAGVDDLYTAWANQQPAQAPAGCWGWRRGSLQAWTTSTLHRLLSCSKVELQLRLQLSWLAGRGAIGSSKPKENVYSRLCRYIYI